MVARLIWIHVKDYVRVVFIGIHWDSQSYSRNVGKVKG